MMMQMIGDDKDDNIDVHIYWCSYILMYGHTFKICSLSMTSDTCNNIFFWSLVIIVLKDANSNAYCSGKPLLLRMCSVCSSGGACPHSRTKTAAFFDHSSWNMSQYIQDLLGHIFSILKRLYFISIILPYLGIHQGDLRPEVWSWLELQNIFPSTYDGTNIINIEYKHEIKKYLIFSSTYDGINIINIEYKQ